MLLSLELPVLNIPNQEVSMPTAVSIRICVNFTCFHQVSRIPSTLRHSLKRLAAKVGISTNFVKKEMQGQMKFSWKGFIGVILLET